MHSSAQLALKWYSGLDVRVASSFVIVCEYRLSNMYRTARTHEPSIDPWSHRQCQWPCTCTPHSDERGVRSDPHSGTQTVSLQLPAQRPPRAPRKLNGLNPQLEVRFRQNKRSASPRAPPPRSASGPPAAAPVTIDRGSKPWTRSYRTAGCALLIGGVHRIQDTDEVLINELAMPTLLEGATSSLAVPGVSHSPA